MGPKGDRDLPPAEWIDRHVVRRMGPMERISTTTPPVLVCRAPPYVTPAVPAPVEPVGGPGFAGRLGVHPGFSGRKMGTIGDQGRRCRVQEALPVAYQSLAIGENVHCG